MQNALVHRQVQVIRN